MPNSMGLGLTSGKQTHIFLASMHKEFKKRKKEYIEMARERERELLPTNEFRSHELSLHDLSLSTRSTTYIVVVVVIVVLAKMTG